MPPQAKPSPMPRDELAAHFADLRSFMDRRIAELSAELHASVQLADMTEAKLSAELQSVQQQIARLVMAPAADTRNSGLELEAVVQATEAAANTIMEAAEAIQDWIADGSQDSASIKTLSDKVNSIFEACSFQDITSQRIRRAIQHLQQVETMLVGIMPEITASADTQPRMQIATPMHTVAAPALAGRDLAQEDIDAMLNM